MKTQKIFYAQPVDFISPKTLINNVKKLKRLLEEIPVDIVAPYTNNEYNHNSFLTKSKSAQQLVNKDKSEISQCDLLVVDFSIESRQAIGIVFEMAYAQSIGKKILVYTGKSSSIGDRVWIHAVADYICETWSEVRTIIEKYFERLAASRSESTSTAYHAKDLINKFEKIYANLSDKEESKEIHELNLIAEGLVNIIYESYNNIAPIYNDIRDRELSKPDKQRWEELHKKVQETLKNSGESKPFLLDIGAGNGRDIRYAQKFLGYHAIGIDNSESFFNIIKIQEKQRKIADDSIFLCDMRELEFKDNVFHVVRYNASLSHMLVTGSGFMADKAIAESYRVLVPEGIIHIIVREGNGIKLIDTDEKLGPRIYQLFDENLLKLILERNHFQSLEISEYTEKRDKRDIKWLKAFAEKPFISID